MPEQLTGRQYIAPAGSRGAAAGGTRTGPGTWAELIDDVGVDDVVLTGIAGEIGFNPGYLAKLWAQFEIGIGAEGDEEAIATFPVLVTGSQSQWDPWVFPEPIDLVPAGSRLAIRMLDTNAVNWSDGHFGSESPRFTVHYMKKPLVGTKSLLTTAMRPYPYSDDPVETPVAVAGDFESAFVTALAAAPDDMKLLGGIFLGQQRRLEVDIAVGAEGDEEVFATIGLFGLTTQYSYGPTFLPHAISGHVPSGSRVSMRCRVQSATVTSVLRIGYVILAPESA